MNIGSTDKIEIKTLATEIRDQIDPDLDLVYEERHDADAEHTHAATDRAEELLGYDPDHTIGRASRSSSTGTATTATGTNRSFDVLKRASGPTRLRTVRRR